ncbi:MAG: hypothetical protein NVS3B9_6800 [Candidatus Doudnabacteria bacterium]
MKILKLTAKNQSEIIDQAVAVLKGGGSVAYPTDTSYGLGVDVSNPKALKKLYQIKERNINQPVHLLVPSVKFAKKLVFWNKVAEKLSVSFWPGPFSMALPIRSSEKYYKKISGREGYLGLRMPKTNFALLLVQSLGKPISATSANPSGKLRGGFDSYSAKDVINQFDKQKYQPDLVIDAGNLKKVSPSTFVIVRNNIVQIRRDGPVSENMIFKVLQK